MTQENRPLESKCFQKRHILFHRKVYGKDIEGLLRLTSNMLRNISLKKSLYPFRPAFTGKITVG